MMNDLNINRLEELRHRWYGEMAPVVKQRFHKIYMLCLQADMLIDRMIDEDYFRHLDMFNDISESLQDNSWLYMGHDAFDWYTREIEKKIKRADTAIEERWE